ncbi:MAG: hypothetical protein K1X88_02790 [Nannocystaceae bacterium]|nr:hypothetical protein [Nannocystaceae bacterium]
MVVLGCGGPPASAPAEQSPRAPAPLAEAPAPTIDAPPPVIERAAVERLVAPEAFVGKHVLVPAGAVLALAAGADAPKLQLRDATTANSHAFAFAVVGHDGEQLLLRPAAPQGRCDDGLGWLGDLDVTVRTTVPQLADVLARESETRFADGTWVRLRPGLAVLARGDDGELAAGGVRMRAPLDARDVGNAYTPAVARAPEPGARVVGPGSAVRYGEHSVDVAAFHDGHARGATVLSEAEGGADRLVELVGACATVRGRVAPEAIMAPMDPPPPRSALAFGVVGGERWTVAAGTAASWRDGTEAGVLADAIELTRAPRRHKARRCFEREDSGGRFEPVELCVAAAAITHVPDPFGALAMIGGLSPSGGSVLAELSAQELAAFDVLGETRIGSTFGSSGGVALGSGGGGTGSGIIGGIVDGDGSGAAALGRLDEPPPPPADEPAPPPAGVAVEIASLSSSGTRDMTPARRTVLARREALAACAERDDPPATGTLSLAFTIGDDGRVKDLELSGMDSIASCARGVVASWRFTGGGTATVELSLDFVAGGGG